MELPALLWGGLTSDNWSIEKRHCDLVYICNPKRRVFQRPVEFCNLKCSWGTKLAWEVVVSFPFTRKKDKRKRRRR